MMLLALPLVLAQGSLYGPEAPRDAAYLRLVNAVADELVATVDGEQWESLAFAEVSPYRIVEPGSHEVEVAGQSLEFEAQPESFSTIVAMPDGPVLISDTALRDISRGLLGLYNLTADSTLSLLTADGSEVLSNVEPGSQKSVAISEAEATLVVRADGEELATLESRLYRRGEAHSVFVLPEGSQPRIVYVSAGAER